MKSMVTKRFLAALASLSFLLGCAGVPAGVEAVRNFEIQRYLGRWYEIARLDHSFERGLEKVYAEYGLRGDGGLRVVNRGFDPASGKWKEATGRAYFAADEGVGMLKVSFFGPFYGAYNIIALDGDYTHALVCGPNRDYLWILSRTPAMEASTTAALVARAKALGFDTQRLVFVKH